MFHSYIHKGEGTQHWRTTGINRNPTEIPEENHSFSSAARYRIEYDLFNQLSVLLREFGESHSFLGFPAELVDVRRGKSTPVHQLQVPLYHHCVTKVAENEYVLSGGATVAASSGSASSAYPVSETTANCIHIFSKK